MFRGVEAPVPDVSCQPSFRVLTVINVDAAHKVRDDVIVLCHGGPISEPADAEYVLRRTKNVHGFFGASSIERLATEPAITAKTEEFKRISFGS